MNIIRVKSKHNIKTQYLKVRITILRVRIDNKYYLDSGSSNKILYIRIIKTLIYVKEEIRLGF